MEMGCGEVQAFLVFSKYLSGPEGQVQALDKNMHPPLSNHGGIEPSCVGAASTAESSDKGKGERLLLLRGFKDYKKLDVL